MVLSRISKLKTIVTPTPSIRPQAQDATRRRDGPNCPRLSIISPGSSSRFKAAVEKTLHGAYKKPAMKNCTFFYSPSCDFNNTDLRWSNSLSESSVSPSDHKSERNPYGTLRSCRSYHVLTPSSPEPPSFPATPLQRSPSSLSAVEVFNPDDPFAEGHVQIVRSSPSLLITPPRTPTPQL
jgi:hypothetical protein